MMDAMVVVQGTHYSETMRLIHQTYRNFLQLNPASKGLMPLKVVEI